MNSISIKIEYDAFFSGNSDNDLALEDFKGIKEFKEALSNDYVSYVKGRGVGRGGVVYDLFVEIIMNITLKNFLELVITGATWDLIKYGTKSLVLRPFVEAFEKLNAQNNDGIRIGRYIFKFEESDVIISSINQRGVFHIVPMVFNEIIKNYDHLKYPNSQRFPDEIRVPIIYDENLKNEYSKYRELIEMEDIELDLDDDNYFKFWGLCYNFDQQHMIYSHKDKKVLNDSFYTAANFEDYLARKR